MHGPGVDNPIVWYEGSAIDGSTRRFLMADERGSVVSITDSSGATLNINSYDEYGIPASGNLGRFGYTGQSWLPEVRLWYYKARMYSPTLGRFLQTDPIGYQDGMNWYNYVGGDPVNKSDPSGRNSDADHPCRSQPQTCPPNDRKYDGPPINVFGTRPQPAPMLPPLAIATIQANFQNGREFAPAGAGGPQSKPCDAPLSSGVGSARDVLEGVALGADIATVGLAAGGVTAPVAAAARLVGYGAEAGIFLVNIYDGVANKNWEPLAVQGASAGTRLIPGGRALQSGLKTVRGPTGALRNSRGQFRSSRLNNPGIKEAGNVAAQRTAGAGAEGVICR